MTKREIKEEAQDQLFAWIQNAFTAADEADVPLEVIREMHVQAQRIVRLFGYESVPGIGLDAFEGYMELLRDRAAAKAERLQYLRDWRQELKGGQA